jgi:hypothetical protein
LIYLEDTGVEGAMSCSGIAPFLRVQECQAKFTGKIDQPRNAAQSHHVTSLFPYVTKIQRGHNTHNNVRPRQLAQTTDDKRKTLPLAPPTDIGAGNSIPQSVYKPQGQP